METRCEIFNLPAGRLDKSLSEINIRKTEKRRQREEIVGGNSWGGNSRIEIDE